MTDEPQDHYAKAVKALDVSNATMRDQGTLPQNRTPQAQYQATYALAHAVLALVQEIRKR